MFEYSLLVTGSLRHVCPKCGKSYKYKVGMMNHVRFECGKDRQFLCPHFPAEVDSGDVEKPFTCSDCGRSYKNKKHLLRHERDEYRAKFSGKALARRTENSKKPVTDAVPATVVFGPWKDHNLYQDRAKFSGKALARRTENSKKPVTDAVPATVVFDPNKDHELYQARAKSPGKALARKTENPKKPVPDAVPATVVPGPRKNHKRYQDSTGYTYRIDSTRPDGRYRMKCALNQKGKKCRGSAVMKNIEGTLMISPRAPHDKTCSIITPQRFELWALKQRIFDRCRRDQESTLAAIFEEESLGSPAAGLTSLNQLLPSMRRYRKEKRPETEEIPTGEFDVMIFCLNDPAAEEICVTTPS
ncbi:hypothetical protein GE061_020264 [Apolygus lucorum]|uniref:C2H2-type domain-containing protein n=1 Tax=Apolygus lucorum TaxID=248454 RepID=A0A8S9WHZ0_APOLU|nr:hypothetical protein GE061_020264 [Apolygus lucorum]